MENTYEIQNSVGQHLWTAKEKSGCCARLCLGNLRPLTITVKDNAQNSPLLLVRPFRCLPGLCCWCKLCLQEMEVMGPGGLVLGFVRQQWHLCLPRFTIQTADGQDVLFIHGPFCVCSCGSDVKFKVLDVSGNQIGLICKRWGGCCQEWITAADNFTVQFPMDMDVKLKANLLAAALLLDYTYFENTDK
uniref:phospholipid scramblase 1-like n=1 Tax=Myxine glutinosa TaxID=7769 RepID=UPI00358F5C5C